MIYFLKHFNISDTLFLKDSQAFNYQCESFHHLHEFSFNRIAENTLRTYVFKCLHDSENQQRHEKVPTHRY